MGQSHVAEFHFLGSMMFGFRRLQDVGCPCPSGWCWTWERRWTSPSRCKRIADCNGYGKLHMFNKENHLTCSYFQYPCLPDCACSELVLLVSDWLISLLWQTWKSDARFGPGISDRLWLEWSSPAKIKSLKIRLSVEWSVGTLGKVISIWAMLCP